MAWTSPLTWVAGSAITAAQLNAHVRDNESWLKDALTVHGITSDTTLQPLKGALYGVRVRRTANQTISDATDTLVLFPTASMTEDFDSHAFHDGATNTGRLTVPSGGDGYYLIGGAILFAANATGHRQVWVEVNGSAGTGTEIVRESDEAYATVGGRINITTVYQLAAADFVTLNVRQTSTGNLDLTASAQLPQFWMTRLFAS